VGYAFLGAEKNCNASFHIQLNYFYDTNGSYKLLMGGAKGGAWSPV